MEQVPLNIAPGSIDSLPATASPFRVELALRLNNSLTVIFPITLPEMSAFWQITSPSIMPVAPTITLPLDSKFPLSVPSIRMSPLEIISPLMMVPAPSKLIEVGSFSVIFAIFIVFLVFENMNKLK